MSNFSYQHIRFEFFTDGEKKIEKLARKQVEYINIRNSNQHQQRDRTAAKQSYFAIYKQ